MKIHGTTSEVVLLLTACVNPNGMSYTVLQNVDVRLCQYKNALDWYLQNTSLQIIFVENTNYDISPFYDDYIKKGRLEILTFRGNDFNKLKGKGYGEALIIDYAIKNSKKIKSAHRIIKITGRLIIENITDLLNVSKKQDCVYADIVTSSLENRICNSICFISPVLFLEKYFLPEKELLDDSNNFYFEHLLYKKCRQWKVEGNEWEEFLFPIFIDGKSGSTGQEYVKRNKWLMYLKKMLTLVLHKLQLYYA